MLATLGFDYGTNSVRALLANPENGEELGTGVFNYPTGEAGVVYDGGDPHLARQNPADYLAGLKESLSLALKQAVARHPGFSPRDVIGIGVDTTGSSPIPVDSKNRALAADPRFAANKAALCWLWKDHTSFAEAAEITELARRIRPQYVAKCGNTYSSEWWWSKLLHCARTSPEVFEAAYSWVELADWVPSVLAGVTDPRDIRRGACAAGHKAFYSEEWGGLPDAEFLSHLDPRLAALLPHLFTTAYDASHKSGELCPEWAEKLGLKAGIPIAIGQFDVHYGAIGSGVAEGVIVKAIGTSTCDCTVAKADRAVADIPGICGIVNGSILPGHLGIEAGQSAVGDIFRWWVEVVLKGSGADHARLSAEIRNQKPGQSGLLALDWNNGNRTILVDQQLTGLLVGQTLRTTQAEIYRALIEATAFGARMIVERIAEYGVPVTRIVCCGGIAEKDSFLMQVYADVTGREMQVARSGQACALGAAVAAAVMAGKKNGGHDSFEAAMAAMTGVKSVVYKPIPENHAVYNKLFALYRQLHDAFGGVGNENLRNVMKDLLRIQKEASVL
ncbi:MAG TPA: ribulokinase [Opitutales bacterium]|nr:ribulokinase [Opitutales bacterium]